MISHLLTNIFSPIYESFVLLGDFSISTANLDLKSLMCSFDLGSLIGSLTCFKSIDPTSFN